MRTTLFGLTLAIGLAAAATPSLADDKARGKALYDEGLKHYNLAEYQEAITAWKDAYSISKKPLLLFNIAQAYRLDGDCKKAMTFYDSYQREEPNPKNQDELDQAVALCAKSDGKPTTKPKGVGTKPASDAKPQTSPTQITAPVADKPKSKPVVAQVPVGPASDGEDRADEPETTGGGLRKAGYGVTAAGVVLGGTAIYFARASKKASDANDGFTGEWGADQVDNEKRGKRDAKIAWIGGGVGLAAIAAGAVMIAIGGPKTADTSVSLIPTRGGAAASWSFRF